MVKAFLDANVLYPAPIRDFLLSLAEEELFKPFWSKEIHEEWKRNLLKNRPDLDQKRIDRTIKLMDIAFPDACIENYKNRIPEIVLRDKKDTHVMAAALEANADFLVTFNLKDFQSTGLPKALIEIIHPNDFISLIILKDRELAKKSFEKMVSRLKNPPLSRDEVIQALKKCGLEKSIILLN